MGERSAGIATGANGSRIVAGKVGAVGEALKLRGALRRAYAEIGCSVSGTPVQLLWLPERERDAREPLRIGRAQPTVWSGDVDVACRSKFSFRRCEGIVCTR